MFFRSKGLIENGRNVKADIYIRQTALGMSKLTYTDVSYWLDMPVIELIRWVESLTALEKAASN